MLENEITINGQLFYWRNFHNVDPEETGQDIYNEKKKHIGQFTLSNRYLFADSIRDMKLLETFISENFI